MRFRFVPLPLVVSLLIACHSRQAESAKQDAQPTSAISVVRLDGGAMTTYSYDSKTRTAPVSDTSLRRAVIILNDRNCPLQITSFGFRTQRPNPVMEREVGARLDYILDWSLMPNAPITSWETRHVVYDAMNRYLWSGTNTNGPRTGDTAELQPGLEHKTERISWWKSDQTELLGRWVTSVVFVDAVRTSDGKVWSADTAALTGAMKDLSLELPARP